MSNSSNSPKMLARRPKQYTSTPSGVVCRIPAELDAELERFIAGTGITKKTVMEMALRDWLKAEGDV